MKNYYLRIFSIASIITILILLTSKTLLSSNNAANENQSNVAQTIRTEKPQQSQLQLSQQKQWRQQLPVLQQNLKKYQQDSNITQEISTLSQIGVIYNELNEYSQALEYLQLAQRKLNASNLAPREKSFIESELLVGLGTIYADQGNYPQVLEITRKISQANSLTIGDLGSEVKPKPDKKQPQETDIRKDAYTLYTIATTQQKRGKVREALRTAEEVLKMLKTVNEKNGEQEVNNFINSLRQQL
jgi:tetratricopeptide (TPR) repeat protein